MSKIITKWIEDSAVTKEKLNVDVAGNGITGGAGTALTVYPDDSTNPAIAPVSVTADGVGVSIDNSSIQHTAGTLSVKNGGITNDMLAGSITDDKLVEQYILANGTRDFTDDQSMGGFKLTNVATCTDGTDAANKNYVDNAVAGLHWKDPVYVPNMVSDVNQGGASPVGPTLGDAYVVNNWGGGYNNGDIIEWDGTQWNVILPNSGGKPPNGTRVTVTGIDGSGALGSFTGYDEQIATYNTTTSTWGFYSPAHGDAVLTIGQGSMYEFYGYTYDTDTSNWVQFTGATTIDAGPGLYKSGNIVGVGQNSAGAIKVNANDIQLNVDNSTVEINGTNPGTLRVKADGITKNEINSNVAGTGLEQHTDGSIRIAAAAAGNGLDGGGGSPLTVLADTTGGANLAKVINVTADGVAVKIDDDTIGENVSGQLYVKPDGIGATEIDETDNYDFTGTFEVVTQDQGDGSDKAATTLYVDTAISGMSTENKKQEMHKITAGETTAGFFSLAETPSNAQSVEVNVVHGPQQVNKQVVASTGATPDFDILNSTELHFNNNGAADGLSEELTTGDIVIVTYSY